MTRDEALEIISVLTAAYPQANLSKETGSLYVRFLIDLSFEIGQAAVLDLISKNKWFPSISELREAANKILPNEIPSVEQAWAEVEEAFHTVGSYIFPSFSHPLIEQAVRTLNWRKLCLSDNPVVDRAHFFKVYESYRVREVEDNLALPEVKMLKEKIRLQIEEKEVKALSELLSDYKLKI